MARLCVLHHSRKLSKGLALSFRGQRYIVQTDGQLRYALRGATVTVVQYADGYIKIVRGQEVLPFNTFDVPKPSSEPVDDKTLHARVDQLVQQRRCSPKSRSAPNHP